MRRAKILMPIIGVLVFLTTLMAASPAQAAIVDCTAIETARYTTPAGNIYSITINQCQNSLGDSTWQSYHHWYIYRNGVQCGTSGLSCGGRVESTLAMQYRFCDTGTFATSNESTTYVYPTSGYVTHHAHYGPYSYMNGFEHRGASNWGHVVRFRLTDGTWTGRILMASATGKVRCAG